MKINLYKKVLALSTLLFASSLVSRVSAQWQLLKQQDACYSGMVTKSGNLLLSDFAFDGTGGIYLSEDNGENWIKPIVKDHSYNKFYEFGDYIFAIGYHAAVARSADEGKSWEMLSYKDAASEVISGEALNSTVAYAMTEHNGKLFIGDFNGAGVLYSEDYGETWKLTDVESLKYTVDKDGETFRYPENIYQLVSFNGKLYAFGVIYVFEYNDEDNDWTIVRDDSNFMAQSAIINGNLYCGRGCPNEDPDAPFLEMTSDFVDWTFIKGPKEIVTRNVRVLYNDDNFVYAATQDRGAFVLDVKDNEWYSLCDGYPEMYPGVESCKGFYAAPTQFFSDDEYLYLVIYDYQGAENSQSGLYRFAKKEIANRTAIENVETEADYYVDGGYIIFPYNNITSADIFDIAGNHVMCVENSDRLFIGNLNRGVYVFEVTVGGKTIKGKFAI